MSDNSRLKSAVGIATGRRKMRINGIVQGVGFRPYVFRLATELNLTGFVINDSDGVLIEVEGSRSALDLFPHRLLLELPPLAKVVECQAEDIQVIGDDTFSIRESRYDALPSTLVSPDVAVCDDCLAELFDPANRRYRYPFINCTNCGPRYTIVEGIPYDRSLTSMKVFPMCPECETEYRDPANRRFHAQPNACEKCGPKLTLLGRHGETKTDNILERAVDLLRAGKIVAIRGVGGFHLAVDAYNEAAIAQLRFRKGRAEKPLALMAPDLEGVRKFCQIDEREVGLLRHYTRPIVLLKKRSDCKLPEVIATRNRCLGFMLPYSPLHHLLLRGNFEALIMTSGNFSEEPIAIANDEALERLKDIADYFLVHDREILQRCDDSIVMTSCGDPQVIRRSRGYVPQPVFLPQKTSRNILAVGGELKNTVALSRDNQVFLSQHIGDLDNPEAFSFFEYSIEHLGKILQIAPEGISYDMHPEYLSTKWAISQDLPGVAVQHHHAHLVSVMADNGVVEPAIGIILDGTGYGTDGTIWGGEVLIGDAHGFSRHAWLQPVPMPGATAAIKQPWRMAVSHLYHAYGRNFADLELPLIKNMDENDLELIIQMMDKGLNSPLTSSCGRLFDAVSALLGIRHEINFEAQAAIELEMAASSACATPIACLDAGKAQGALDAAPIIRAIIDGYLKGESAADLSSTFHTSLAELFLSSAINAREQTGINRVGLSGGVYQNRYFTECLVRRLQDEKFNVLRHHQVPPNDGGLPLGQVVVGDALLAAGVE